jgi:hypothetical protein
MIDDFECLTEMLAMKLDQQPTRTTIRDYDIVAKKSYKI